MITGPRFVFLCFFAIVFSVVPADAQSYITLIKGGGITGNSTFFRISSTGEVAKSTGSIEPEFSAYACLKKSRTRKYFRKTRALLKGEAFNYPGNTFTAITLNDSGKEIKWVWGDGHHEPPIKAQKLYQKIQTSLNRLTFRDELRK